MSRAPLPLLLGLLALGACGSEPTPAAGRQAQSVLLVTLDTTRRDALGCYGRSPSPSPALDRFAAESRLFDAARTVTPMTLPSHASMLTGLIPPRHTVRDNSRARLPEEAHTVAEAASEIGHRTGAILAAPVLDASFGLAQGFAHYDAPTQAEARDSGRHGGRIAQDVTQRALSWIDSDAAAPFFLWVHYFDPHESYEPAPAFLAAAGDSAYHGEVAQMDDAFGMLLAGLRARGLDANTAIIVVADHGEALEEHGEETHSTFVYDSTLSVPLLIHDPAGHGRGTREPLPVSVVDVAPTLIDALGGTVPPDLDGSSLWRRPAHGERAIYFESLYGAGYFQWAPLVGVVFENRKYIHSSRPEVFDVVEDPGELQLLVDEEYEERALAALQVELERTRLGASERAGVGPSTETLRALGYVGEGLGLDPTTTPELDAEGRPSPHDRADELRAIRRVLALHNEGRLEEVVPLARAILERDPRNHTIMSLLGTDLLKLGRPEEALEPLERFGALGPPWESTWLELARCYVRLERVDEALAWYDRLLDRRRDGEIASEVARVFAHAQRSDEGVTWLAERGFAQRR